MMSILDDIRSGKGLPPISPIDEMGAGMMENTVKINVETEGFEEATEKIEMLVDAYDGFPAQLTIKNCHDCNFYIYPSQNKTIVGGEQE